MIYLIDIYDVAVGDNIALGVVDGVAKWSSAPYLGYKSGIFDNNSIGDIRSSCDITLGANVGGVMDNLDIVAYSKALVDAMTSGTFVAQGKTFTIQAVIDGVTELLYTGTINKTHPNDRISVTISSQSLFRFDQVAGSVTNITASMLIGQTTGDIIGKSIPDVAGYAKRYPLYMVNSSTKEFSLDSRLIGGVLVMVIDGPTTILQVLSKYQATENDNVKICLSTNGTSSIYTEAAASHVNELKLSFVGFNLTVTQGEGKDTSFKVIDGAWETHNGIATIWYEIDNKDFELLHTGLPFGTNNTYPLVRMLSDAASIQPYLPTQNIIVQQDPYDGIVPLDEIPINTKVSYVALKRSIDYWITSSEIDLDSRVYLSVDNEQSTYIEYDYNAFTHRLILKTDKYQLFSSELLVGKNNHPKILGSTGANATLDEGPTINGFYDNVEIPFNRSVQKYFFGGLTREGAYHNVDINIPVIHLDTSRGVIKGNTYIVNCAHRIKFNELTTDSYDASKIVKITITEVAYLSSNYNGTITGVNSILKSKVVKEVNTFWPFIKNVTTDGLIQHVFEIPDLIEKRSALTIKIQTNVEFAFPTNDYFVTTPFTNIGEVELITPKIKTYIGTSSTINTISNVPYSKLSNGAPSEFFDRGKMLTDIFDKNNILYNEDFFNVEASGYSDFGGSNTYIFEGTENINSVVNKWSKAFNTAVFYNRQGVVQARPLDVTPSAVNYEFTAEDINQSDVRIISDDTNYVRNMFDLALGSKKGSQIKLIDPTSPTFGYIVVAPNIEVVDYLGQYITIRVSESEQFLFFTGVTLQVNEDALYEVRGVTILASDLLKVQVDTNIIGVIFKLDLVQFDSIIDSNFSLDPNFRLYGADIINSASWNSYNNAGTLARLPIEYTTNIYNKYHYGWDHFYIVDPDKIVWATTSKVALTFTTPINKSELIQLEILSPVTINWGKYRDGSAYGYVMEKVMRPKDRVIEWTLLILGATTGDLAYLLTENSVPFVYEGSGNPVVLEEAVGITGDKISDLNSSTMANLIANNAVMPTAIENVTNNKIAVSEIVDYITDIAKDYTDSKYVFQKFVYVAGTIGATQVIINHSLNTTDLSVTVVDLSTNQVSFTSPVITNTQIIFNGLAPLTMNNQIKVIILR